MAKSRTKKRTSPVKVFLIVFIILVIVFTGGRLLLENFGLMGIESNPIAEGSGDFGGAERINTLLLGTTKEDLTDTMMLVSFDKKDKRVDVISIPRDTYYHRPDHPGPAWQKINSVWKSEGFEGVTTAVSDVLGGIPVHSYAMIDDPAVAAIVDSMGGIDIYVPMDMDYEDAPNDLYIHLTEGQQTLNGDQAVQYLRFRKGYADGDLGRVNAQQEFMRELFNQSLGIGLPKVIGTVINEVDTSLSATAALGLGTNAIGMNSDDITTWTIPGYQEYMDGLSYFFADPEGTKELMDEIYSL